MSAHEIPEATFIPKMCDCVICQGKWPEHLTVKHGEDYICCPCHGKLKDEAFCRLHADKLSRYRIGNTSGGKGKLVGWLIVAMLVLAGGGYGLYLLVQGSQKKADKPPEVVIIKKSDVGSVLIGSSLTLKSKVTLAATTYLVRGPKGIVGVVPAVSFANTTTPTNGAKPSQANGPIFSLFEKWALVPIFPFTPSKKDQGPIVAIGLEGDPDLASQKAIWLLQFNPADLAEPPVKIFETQAAATVSGASLGLLRVITTDGKPSQDLVQARVDTAFMNGARLSVALATRLPAKGLLGAPLVNPDGKFVGVVDGFGEPPDAQGTVKFVEVMSSFELFGLQPPAPPKPPESKDAKEGDKPAKKNNPILNKILPNGSPYDQPEYKELQ